MYLNSRSNDSLPSTITQDYVFNPASDMMETCSIPNTPDPFESYATASPEEPVEQARIPYHGKNLHPIIILLANETPGRVLRKDPPKQVSLMQALALEGHDHSILHPM
jgi:hypothetical protein